MLVLSSGCNPPHPYLTLKRTYRFSEEYSARKICKRNTDNARLNPKVALKMSGDTR